MFIVLSCDLMALIRRQTLIVKCSNHSRTYHTYSTSDGENGASDEKDGNDDDDKGRIGNLKNFNLKLITLDYTKYYPEFHKLYQINCAIYIFRSTTCCICTSNTKGKYKTKGTYSIYVHLQSDGSYASNSPRTKSTLSTKILAKLSF